MAVSTVDFEIRPEDGWTLVATNPTLLIVRPVEHRPYWIAATVTGAPAAGIEGLKYGRGGDAFRENFTLTAAFTGEIYIRTKEPPNSAPSSHAHFGVIRDQ
jgi:hypothetical protein